MQQQLARLLAILPDPAATAWTGLENRPRTQLSAIFQRPRGVKSGWPDLIVIWHGRAIFVEFQKRARRAECGAKHVRAELTQAGASWWMARSANGALMAL
jgi:hypothetical protein